MQDPELYISIVDLGLIYDVKVKGDTADIKMTLTTIGCPLFSLIENEVKDKVLSLKGIGKVNVELVFNPPWTIERLSEKAKAMIGI